jgi:hypothetical protein
MSDEPQGISFQGGQGGSPNASTGSQEGENPEYFTRKEARHELEAFKQDVQRYVQSLTDKAEDRTNKRIKQEMANLTRLASVAQLTPEQVAAARAKIFEDAYTEEPLPAPSSHAAAQPQAAEQRNQPAKSEEEIYVGRARARLVRKYGYDLADTDPEVTDTLRGEHDPDKFIDLYEEALQRKHQRVSTPAAGRMPAMGGAPSGDRESKLLAEYKERAKQVRGNINAVFNLRREFAERGLTRFD